MKYKFCNKKAWYPSVVSWLRQYVWNVFINGLMMSYFFPVFFCRFVFNYVGMKIDGVIHGHCTILTNKLSVGKSSFINRNCFIDNNAMVTIGENCAIGYNVTIATSNHLVNDSIRRGKICHCQLTYKMAVG